MMKLLLAIGAVLAVTVSRTDGTVTLPTATLTRRQGRPATFSCQVSGETFVGWRTPAKAARPGVAAIPSVNIPASQTTGRKRIATSGDTYELTIDKLTVEDGGEYICQGTINFAVFTLHIDYEIGDVVKAQTLTLGQKGTIVLDVPAYPPLDYTWKKDGKELTFPTPGKTLDPYTGSITITIVQVSDEGSYTCEVIFNKAPSGESVAIEVEVVDKPQILKYQGDPVKRRLTEGNNETFHCDVKSGRPTPDITWYFGWVDKTKKVDTQYDERYSHLTNETWTITGIQKQDQGQYRCIAENSAGEDDLRFDFTVDVPPTIDPMETVIVKTDGEKVDIECVASGDPTPIVEWFHHGGVYPGQTTFMRGEKKVAKISFAKIDIFHTGEYTCQAKNGAMDSKGQVIVVKKTVKLYVRSAPQIDTVASPTPVYSYVGNMKAVTVTCEFFGYPIPTVRMYSENGTEIARGNTTASYTFQTTTNKDFGKFNCTAENPDGKAQFWAELKLAMPPGPPRSVAANKTCKDIILNWQPPLDNGGMKILNYIITVLLNGKQLNIENADGAAVQHEIFYDVKPETKYEIRIKARSEPGPGKEEVLFVETDKYCVPGAPLITSPPDKSTVDIEFTLIWLAPRYDGGDDQITYRLELRKTPITKDTEVRIEDNIEETQFVVKGLDHGITYDLRLYAVNRAGDSEPDAGTLTTKKKTGIEAIVSKLGAGAIAGIVIAIILLILITIDFFCCFFNKCGVIFCCHQALCGGGGSGGGGGPGGKDDYMDGKASEMEKKPLPKNTEDV